MVSDLVFNNQPKMIGVSVRKPSSFSFPRDKQLSRIIFSCPSTGLKRMWIAKNIACIALFGLSPRSGTITIPSSMKSSTFPQSSCGSSKSRHSAGTKGKSAGSYFAGSTFAECGDEISCGPQCGQWSISFARSVHSSNARQNSLGQGEPPKVSRRLVSPNSSNIIVCITV